MSLYKRLAGLSVVALASLTAAGATGSAATAASSCASYTWQSSPKVIVHEQEFLDGGGSSADAADMVAAVQHVVDQFNAIGHTSARITKVETTTDPFVYNSGKKDGAIHVGFGTRADILAAHNGKDADGVTHAAEYTDCSIKQADILFPDQNSPDAGGPVMWDFGTPFGKGDGSRFFDATPTDSAKDTWFRPSFQHELLHAWGFKHLTGTYTFMTHRNPAGFPWANRPANASIRPLPYEVGVLRSEYPGSGTRYDVAALNTWYGPPNTPTDDAGSQIDLCKPSLGGKWSDNVDGSDTSALTCGLKGANAGSTAVCPGDSLRTRVTLANYSTTSMIVTTELFFSKGDDKWQDSDVDSPSANNKTLGAEESGISRGKFTVPALGAGTYRPILRTISEDTAADAESVQADWIPLLGKVTVGNALDCPPSIG